MSNVFDLFSQASGFITFALTITFITVLITLLNRHLRSRWEENKFQFQFLMLCLSLVAAVITIIALPLSDTLRGQLLTLFGILLSGAIAFSSTTFIGNILAGLMLRAIKNIKLGDYITVNDVTGRATEMNLLHVEVQTEQSDLVTIPNIHMVTYPVKVVQSKGTIVSIDISLGYDISRLDISNLLCLASEDAGLSEGFVQVRNLGDFSVTYRIAGQLNDISNLLSARAHLFNAVLDRLHSEKIEIVSPNFMNTRSLDGTKIIPKHSQAIIDNSENSLEKLAFEKAEAASVVTKIQTEIDSLSARLSAEDHSIRNNEREVIKSRIIDLKQKLKNQEESLEQNEGVKK